MIIQIEMGEGYKRTVAELGAMGAALIKGIAKGLDKGGKLAASKVSRDYLHGQSLKARSGSLRRAIDSWMVSDGEVVIGVKPNSAVDKYKWLLGDEQRTITPKNAKFLTIPIGEGLTSAGVARYSSPRQVPDGFFIRTKSGKLLFGYKKGKRGKFRPLFVLVKSVFVQGSGALYDGVLDSEDEIASQIETEIAKQVGAA